MARLVLAENNIYQVDSAYADPKGEYELFRIKDEAGKNEMTCYLCDKCKGMHLTKGDNVKVLKIERVSLGWKQKEVYDKQAGGYVKRWVQQTAANVEVAKQAADLEDAPDLDWIDEMEDAQLPWDNGDLMP